MQLVLLLLKAESLIHFSFRFPIFFSSSISTRTTSVKGSRLDNYFLPWLLQISSCPCVYSRPCARLHILYRAVENFIAACE